MSLQTLMQFQVFLKTQPTTGELNQKIVVEKGVIQELLILKHSYHLIVHQPIQMKL